MIPRIQSLDIQWHIMASRSGVGHDYEGFTGVNVKARQILLLARALGRPETP